MANLTLTRQWVENIYQLETSDPVMGGPDGIDNRQAKELGARTNWLKDQVDTINQDLTDYAPKTSPAFTGIPTAPTAAAGTNNAQIATTAFVKTAIAALVGSAPAALDTLEELAQALTGETNIKATLLAEIGKKANISHTHTVSQITDFNQSVKEIVTQSITQGFTQNLAETGWCKLPNGMILQWGKARDGVVTTFPIAFPARCCAVTFGQIVNVYSYDAALYFYNKTNFKAYIQRDEAVYMAIGY